MYVCVCVCMRVYVCLKRVKNKVVFIHQNRNEQLIKVLIIFKTLLSLQYPYSSEFSIGQSTSVTPFFIWYEIVLLYFS